MPDFTLGCDISRYQGEVDFAKMKTAGAKFVVIRATVGNYYTDPLFVQNFSDAKAAGLLVGAYHVVRPDITYLKQFVYLEQACQGMTFDLPLTLDCEVFAGQSSATVTSVIQNLAEALGRATGNNPIIYTRFSWWQDPDNGVLPWSRWKDYPLFTARYNTNITGPWSDGYGKFRDWLDWTFWQWSADGNLRGAEFGCSGSKSVDLDYFNGTYEQLLAFCGKTTPVVKVCSVCGRAPVDINYQFCPWDGTKY